MPFLFLYRRLFFLWQAMNRDAARPSSLRRVDSVGKEKKQKRGDYTTTPQRLTHRFEQRLVYMPTSRHGNVDGWTEWLCFFKDGINSGLTEKV